MGRVICSIASWSKQLLLILNRRPRNLVLSQAEMGYRLYSYSSFSLQLSLVRWHRSLEDSSSWALRSLLNKPMHRRLGPVLHRVAYGHESCTTTHYTRQSNRSASQFEPTLWQMISSRDSRQSSTAISFSTPPERL